MGLGGDYDTIERNRLHPVVKKLNDRLTEWPHLMKDSPSPYEIILFDVGDVLVEFKGSWRLIEQVNGEITEEKIRVFCRATTPGFASSRAVLAQLRSSPAAISRIGPPASSPRV